jgi:hypothetical protein
VEVSVCQDACFLDLWTAQQSCWTTSMASKKLDASTTSLLHFAAFSIAAPMQPARRGRLHRATRLSWPPPTSRRASSSSPGSGWHGQPSSSHVGTWRTCVARWPGERVVASQVQTRRRRSCSLPDRTTILGRRLARTSCSPLCSALYGRRLKKTHVASVCSKCFGCCRSILQVF